MTTSSSISQPMFSEVKKWAEFVKISHTVFALPFAIAAMVIAARDQHGWPGWEKFLLILAAMFCARTCAMSFNRIADRHFDAQNPRTAGRHLPAGKITLASAWALCLTSAAGLMVAAGLLNNACLYLSPVAVIVVCFYSLTKRFTDFTHVYLGVALGLAPIGAWLAVKGGFDFWPAGHDGIRDTLRHSAFLPVLLSVVVVFWLIGFDIIYAIQDYEFDRAHGLHSIVVRWGPKNALAAAFIAHLFMLVLLTAFGILAGFRIAFFIGMFIIVICVFLEHLLAQRRSLNWINNAFFRLNAVISLVFMAVTVTEVMFDGGFRMR